MARPVRRVARVARKGVPHKLTSARAAQIHRWQLLGAASRKGRHKAQRAGHHNALAKKRKNVTSGYANAVKWGTAKILVPTSLVTPAIPGWQPGDRLPGARFRGKRR